MMAAALTPPDLKERLPSVRGRMRFYEPLARYTWFRVGGAAEAFFEPEDTQDLADFLAACPRDIPITVLGGTSNVLIRDGGVPGVVLRLGKAFAGITVDGLEITAGAAAPDPHVAKVAAEAGIGGLAFLIGIPGVVGGAVRMNAGAYGREVADIFVSCCVMDRSGAIHTLAPNEVAFSYRHTTLAPEMIVLSATFQGYAEAPEAIQAQMTDIQTEREATQPVKARTGGSTFANPPGHKAWELIDAVGGRGLQRGGAQISPLHCNFLINTGDATATDLEALGEEVRQRIKDRFDIELRWEIQRIGEGAKRSAPGEAK